MSGSVSAITSRAPIIKVSRLQTQACRVAASFCRAQEDAGEQKAEPVVERMLKDEIIRLTNIKASAKIRSVWSKRNSSTDVG